MPGLLRQIFGLAYGLLVALCGLAVIAVAGLFLLARGARDRRAPPRLLWGTAPTKSLSYMARALRAAGYRSETAVRELYPIVEAADFDHLSFPRSASPLAARLLSGPVAVASFVWALFRYDVFHYYFDGGLLGRTLLGAWEIPILQALGKKVVLLPYGSDAFVYDRIADLTWRHALIADYPGMGGAAAAVERRLRRGCRQADAVIGCLVHCVNLPRWDVLPLVCYPVDCEALQPRWPRSSGPIVIAHAPNHRVIKGTEFLLDAVDALRHRGHAIELRIIEGRPNREALALMADCDLFFDQIHFGYGLAALEAMALGKVVISGRGNESHDRLFRLYSYLDECPITFAAPETLEETLSELIARRGEWPAIGRRCRAFAERRHSFAAMAAMYEAVYRRIWHGEEVDLINLYNPRVERTEEETEVTAPLTVVQRS